MAGRGMRARALVAAGLVVASLAACDIRVEAEPAPTPTADAATAARDQAARNEAAIIAALGVPAGTGAGRAELDALESAAAPVHLDILGGVYEPFPSPSATPPASQPGDLRAAVASARDDALDLAFAQSEDPAGFLAGSMGLTHAFAVWYAGIVDARRAGVAVPVVLERGLPGPHGEGVALTPEASSLSSEVLADLARRHDEARFTYEVIAARESGARRALALERAAMHRARSDALTALAGSDVRTPVYELPNALVADEPSRDAAARLLEQSLGWRYAELTSGVAAEDRAWLMGAAFDAYAASATLPGFTVSEFPVLPGVDQP